jgi:hypothetical protein
VIAGNVLFETIMASVVRNGDGLKFITFVRSAKEGQTPSTISLPFVALTMIVITACLVLRSCERIYSARIGGRLADELVNK